MCRIFSRGKIDMCRMGIFFKAVDKFFPFSIKMRWWIGICLMRSSHIFFHPSSYCPALFVHLPSGSLVMLRCVRRSEVFITHAAVSTAHSRMAAYASLLSHPAVSHYYTTRARSLARSSIAHTLLFSSQCAHWFIYFYNDLFFLFFFMFGINRSLCCTASFTLDEPSEWSGDLQTTKSRNNNIEKVSHPIVFTRDYRIWVGSANGRI